MSINATIRVGVWSVGRRWQGMTRLRRLLVVGISTLLALALFLTGYWWVGYWPYRLILQQDGGHYPVTFSPDGATLATASSSTGVIDLWNVRTGAKRATWTQPVRQNYYTGKFSKDGRTFASPDYPRQRGQAPSVDLIDVATGKVRARVQSTRVSTNGSFFLDDNKTLRLLAVDQSAVMSWMSTSRPVES